MVPSGRAHPTTRRPHRRRSEPRQAIDDGLDGLVRLSHAIHAHPEAGLRGGAGLPVDGGAAGREGLRRHHRYRRPAHRLQRPGRLRALWWWPSAPSTTPCPASAMPAATTSSPPRRSAPAWGWPGWPTSWASPSGCSARRPRRAEAARSLMLEAGVFDDVHAAMMVHPWPTDRLEGTCLAVSHFDVGFSGQERPRLGRPVEGVNAGDAMAIAQVAIGLLRQQLRPGDQVHGVVTDGGRGGQHHPRSGDRTVHVPFDRHSTGSAGPRAAGHGLLRSRGPGHRLHGSTASTLPPPTPIWRATTDCSTATGTTPRPSARFASTTRARPGRRSRPTWPTSPWPSPPSTRWSPSRRRGRSTTSPSSPPPAPLPSADTARPRRRGGHGVDGHRRSPGRAAAHPAVGPATGGGQVTRRALGVARSRRGVGRSRGDGAPSHE